MLIDVILWPGGPNHDDQPSDSEPKPTHKNVLYPTLKEVILDYQYAIEKVSIILQCIYNYGGKNDGVASYFVLFNTVGSESSAPKGIATLVIKIFCHDKNLSK